MCSYVCPTIVSGDKECREISSKRANVFDMSSHELLPEIFNAVEVEQYLKPLLSEKNLESTMRVVLNLVSGRGVTHKNKPGETFRKNQPVVPTEDLEKLRDDAIEWLPSDLDKGHGWALKHPITKLV